MEINRYHRQMLLPELGAEGQNRLSRASMLIVGVGGLGSPIALALAGAGVGTIGFIDDDEVSLTNLHRQLLYGESQLGQPKAKAAAQRLANLNSEVCLRPHVGRFTASSACNLISSYDLVIDGCDNFATRYVIDDACAQLGKPYIYGAVGGLEGQVSVFHYGASPRRYRDLYPDEQAMLSMPQPGKEILGTVPGVVGNIMAQQAMQLVAGFGELLTGRLWTINLGTLETYCLEF